MHTDGNSIGGLLGELFVAEMTTSRRTCQTCGDEHPVGSHRLYEGAGHVLRCPGCGDVAAVVAALPGEYAISLRGTWRLERSSG
jgi:Family of unknown function (DUF6510)